MVGYPGVDALEKWTTRHGLQAEVLEAAGDTCGGFEGADWPRQNCALEA